MSDRLALANAIEDAGIERGKAERVASVIVDLIHDQVATKADVRVSEAAVRADVQAMEASLRAEIGKVDARVDLLGHQLLTRLGALIIVVVGAAFAALHYWPPH